jgi:HAE1 family hydrophobic/amphiphilic exporter-1
VNSARFVVKHKVVVAMILIVLVAFGFYSLVGQNIAFLSDVNLPSVIVYTIYPGASAGDVEKDVTKILEDDFVTLPNYKSMDSISQDSVSWITVYYQDDVDPYDQLAEIRYRISQLLDDLPDGVTGEPNAIVGGSSMLPSMMFTIQAGNDTARTTDYFNKTLRPMINQIPGVSEVSLNGGKELQAQVKLRPDDLVSKGVSVIDVYKMLQASNTELPLGDAIYHGRVISARYGGSYTSIEDLRNLTIGADSDHNLIKLSDVADVSLGYPETKYWVSSDGVPLLVVNVTNRSDGNIVRINKSIKSILESESERTGNAVKFQIINDYSKTTLSSLNTVVQSGILGVIMAVIVIALFLSDFRMTLIISLSIPLSVLFSFIGMKVAGISINLMSLSGLVTALGMVVDASIVMLEQVSRYYQKGEMPLDDCIVQGSGEVTSSILASNLTTIVVFVPVAMLSGLVGMILKDVALTLIFAIAGSFFVAVFFVPFLMSTMMRKKVKVRKESVVDKGMHRLEDHYKNWLSWSIDNHRFILLLSLLLLVITVFTVGKLGMAFIPSTDNGDFYVDLKFPRGYALEDTSEKMVQAEKIIRSLVPEMDNLVSYQGRSSGFSSLGSLPNLGNFYINLVPVKDRTRNVRTIMLSVQKALSEQIPDCTVSVANGGFDKLLGYASGGGGYGLTLISEDMDALYKEAERIRDHLQDDPSVVTVSMDTSFDTHTMTIEMAQDYMASLGISSVEAGLTSLVLFSGTDCGRFSDAEGNRYPIRLSSTIADQPVSENMLSSMQVKSLAGTLVDFSNIADFKVVQSISAINHTDRAKTITISASLVSEDALPVTNRMQQYLEENPLQYGITSKSGGINELIGDSLPTMIRALAIAFFLLYTVMVLQFERFRQPLIVMISIPFCVIGVVIGLLSFGSTISLLSLLGVISLGGIVVNNAIILIDYVNLCRAKYPLQEGENIHDHLKMLVAKGSATRLRPIFMTTLTTMLGVVPMAMAHGEGAELYAPLGQAIAGGLFTSTLITLFLVPTLYFMTEDRILRKKEREAIK